MASVLWRGRAQSLRHPGARCSRPGVDRDRERLPHPGDESALRCALKAGEAGLVVPAPDGPEAKLRAAIAGNGLDPARREIVDAPPPPRRRHAAAAMPQPRCSHAAAAQAVTLIRAD